MRASQKREELLQCVRTLEGYGAVNIGCVSSDYPVVCLLLSILILMMIIIFVIIIIVIIIVVIILDIFMSSL